MPSPQAPALSPHLSKHFTLAEMVRSQLALRQGIDNQPSPQVYIHLARLCNGVLEPVRALFHAPLFISSGYRCHVLNRLVGGAKGSQHTFGEAADFTVAGIDNEAAVAAIRASDIPYDQLILEGGNAGWVHVSCAVDRLPRRQVLRAEFRNGTARYAQW